MEDDSVGNGDVRLIEQHIDAFAEQDDETLTLSRTELEELQYHVHMLQNAHAASEEKGQSPTATRAVLTKT
jgi:hypothetical protein